jgi:hypothetical protein
MFNKFAAFEEAFATWRRDGTPGLKAESYKYVEFLTSKDDDRPPSTSRSDVKGQRANARSQPAPGAGRF